MVAATPQSNVTVRSTDNADSLMTMPATQWWQTDPLLNLTDFRLQSDSLENEHSQYTQTDNKHEITQNKSEHFRSNSLKRKGNIKPTGTYKQ